MDRRDFLRSVGALAGAAAGAGLSGVGCGEGASGWAFDAERRGDRDLFPRPADGEVLAVSPPPFAWLPARKADAPESASRNVRYQIEVARAGGRVIYTAPTGKSRIHVPGSVFPPADYTWDVIALDRRGRELLRRGAMRFSIAGGAVELPWVAPSVLLARVPESHPRLIYRADDLPRQRRLAATTRSNRWAQCRKLADEALDLPPLAHPTHHLIADESERLLAYQQYYTAMEPHVVRALIHAPLAYLITEEDRYAEAAKRTLLAVASWPVDNDDVTSVTGAFGDEVGLRLARVLPLAYDWLHPALTDEERHRVRQCCVLRGRQMHRRLHRRDFHSFPGESHDGRIVNYMAQMALALAGECDLCEAWLDYSLKSLMSVYPHWGGCDGGWAQGVSFAMWYADFRVPALEALKNVCGLDLWQRPFYRQFTRFILYCSSPRAEYVPFGDGAERSMASHELPFATYAHALGDPFMGWWQLRAESARGGGNDIRCGQWGEGPEILAFDDDPPTSEPRDLPQSEVFRGVGWVGMHSALAEPEHDTLVLFKSSPYGSVSHSHPDQNSFAILKGGKALAIPSGYYAPRYMFPHHREWTHSSRANNTVLVGGVGQSRLSARARGRMTAFEDRPGLSYACGNATEAYAGALNRFFRHVLFVRPGLVLVLDDLAAEPQRFQWMLHALERMDVDESSGHIVSRREGARLDVHLRSPAGLSFSQTDAFDPPVNEGVPDHMRLDLPNQWHLTAETQRPAGGQRIAAVMVVSGPDDQPTVRLLEQGGWFGARVAFGGETTEAWAQLMPGAPGPHGFGAEALAGARIVCGRTTEDVFSA